MISKFISVLFDENEATCFTLSPKGTTIIPVTDADPTKQAYFSINPILLNEDKNPTEEWHSHSKGRRSDDNVTVYRNVLIEADKLTFEEQQEHIRKIALPYTTAIFSGSKSIHYIISLETPLTSRSEYDKLVRRIYRAVGTSKIDRACKNPSRLSRLPGHLRIDTGKIQSVVDIRARIKNAYLENWLLENNAPPEPEYEDIDFILAPKDFSSLSGLAKNFLMYGKQMPAGQWNPTLFKVAAELCRKGWNIEEAHQELLQVTGVLDKNDEKTIRSAFNNEINQQKRGVVTNDKTN